MTAFGFNDFGAGRLPSPGRLARDRLAHDRAAMANERTVLAYVRLSIGLLVGGLAVVKLVAAPAAPVVGWAMVAAGAGVLALGAVRFARRRARLAAGRRTLWPRG